LDLTPYWSELSGLSPEQNRAVRRAVKSVPVTIFEDDDEPLQWWWYLIIAAVLLAVAVFIITYG
jgi:hypothetical protein